ncbi:MAG TPA: GntR family transcriptional regulator, partial [Thermoanaerobaculia bacterium]|nr:GntR family transcriptional regulator [Thermoanaerobaculia bacterium]
MPRRRDEIRDALRCRVTNELHLGLLHAGDRLASARETARELGTDYRVVVSAARELAHEGLLEIRPRSGIFVRARSDRRDRAALLGFGTRLIELLLDEVENGASVSTVAERLRRCLDGVRLRAACIECNRDQIEFLSRELRITYGLEASGVEIDGVRGNYWTLRQADLLVSTVFHAEELRHLAARLGKPWIVATLDPRRRAEIARLLTEGPVYFIGTDLRWAAKARLIWAGVPGEENLRPLTIGHDRLDDIPAQAPVMVMPAAR